MRDHRWLRWGIPLIGQLFVACQPATVQPMEAMVTPLPSATVPPALAPTLASMPTSSPAPVPTPTLFPTPVSSRSPQVPVGQALTPPYTLIENGAIGYIRGRLFFPSQFVPSLAVYAVAMDGSRFYRVDTQPVPPGEPGYEIPWVEPGTYVVYAYPSGDDVQFGGAYSYLAACEAGHFPPPAEGCWEDSQHDLAPVEVMAGQAVEEVDILDWYGPSLPPPPGDTSNWPTYTNEQLAYRISYPPHWQVQRERQGETTFGPSTLVAEGASDGVFASVRVTNGDPQELVDQLIASLPPGDVLVREWRPLAGHDGLYLALELPQGRFAWWFVPRYELVYVVHAVTDSGLGSFDQVMGTFAFVE